jgi:trehalose-6-phosphatase
VTVACPDPCLATVLAEAQCTQRIRLLLDYDGTLVPIARAPELAALVAHRVHAEAVADCFVTAIGDDRTDEDLFRALPASSATVAVGSRPSCARFRVADHREVRRILRALVSAARTLNPSARESVPAFGAARKGVCLVGGR